MRTDYIARIPLSSIMGNKEAMWQRGPKSGLALATHTSPESVRPPACQTTSKTKLKVQSLSQRGPISPGTSMSYMKADRCGKNIHGNVRKGVGVTRRATFGSFVPPVKASVYVQSETIVRGPIRLRLSLVGKEREDHGYPECRYSAPARKFRLRGRNP
ncbi:uncharacterized [Tachysurus ichikawai]